MRLETLQTACAQLSSTKLGERKEGAECILECLRDSDSEEICRTLDWNSLGKDKSGDKFTWTCLFKAASNYFLREAEKLSSITPQRMICFNVVDCVYQKGTSIRPWIFWKEILNCLTTALNSENIGALFGSSMMAMLHNFLSIDYYASVIEANKWIELIQLLIKLSGQPRHEIPIFTVLQCINICVQEGSNHPTVIATLRTELVEFYERFFAADRLGTHNIAVVLAGLTTLCRKNALEFRGILCKFGESIIPDILNGRRYTVEEEGPLIDFLLTQVQLHCPCDVDFRSFAFMASDQLQWKDILVNIYNFCIDVLEDFAIKKQGHFNRDLQVPDKLFHLAAKCTKLYSDLQSDDGSYFISTDEDLQDDHRPSKKLMRSRSFHSFLNDICNSLKASESQLHWLNYFTAVLTQFPQLVDNRSNFSSLFVTGTEFLKSSYATRRDVYLFFLCLLNTEQYLIDRRISQGRTKSWDNIWDLTIRSLSVGDFKPEALELLRRLLIEVQPSNAHSLLLLYTGGSMPMTQSTLNLLAEFLSRCSLPSSLHGGAGGVSSCPRSLLINWLISCQSEDLTIGHEPLVATILCSLLIRQTQNLICTEGFCSSSATSSRRINVTSELSQFETVYEDFEVQLLKGCFVRPPKESIESNNTDPFPTGLASLKLSLIPLIAGRLADSLKQDYDSFLVFDHKVPNFMKKFTKLSYRVALYLNATNILEKYFPGSKGGTGEELNFRTSLEHLFSEALSRCIENGIDFVTKGKNKTALQVQELIAVMRNVFKSSPFLCDGIKAMLAQRFPQHLQELLKKVYRSNLMRHIEKAANNNETPMFGSSDIFGRILSSSGNANNVEGITEGRQIELAALESLGCLIDYAFVCDHRMDLFTELLKECIAETYLSSIPSIFEFSSELINRLVVVLKSSIGKEYSDVLTLVTNLLQKMCRGFYQVPNCSVRLWDLFGKITSLASKDTDINKYNLMVLVGTLSGFLKSDTPHGSSIPVCQAGFRALNELAKHDCQMVWSVFIPKKGPELWVLNDTYQFLTNPSHQIRNFACETICTTYEYAAAQSSVPPTYYEKIKSRPFSLEMYFDKIFGILQEMFLIPIDCTPTEIAEEVVNRTMVALTCLTRLVFGYSYTQKKVLFSFLQLVKIKSLDLDLANRALFFASPMAAKTMRCHISFLIHEWMNHGYAVDEVPYNFFGCESLGAFYNEFKKEICVELFTKNDTEGLSKLASFFNAQLIELIKECYGMLMASIVPPVAVYKATNQPLAGRDSAQFQELRKRLNSALGGQSDTLMATRMEDVVLQLVNLVFNPEIPSSWGCPNSFILPEPSSPYYDESAVNTGLNFLKQVSSRNCGRDVSLVAAMAAHSPRSIYDILLTLIKRVHGAHDVLEKFWRLHQFSYFVSLMLLEPPPIFNTMKEYVCQFVIYGYIRLLSLENGIGEYNAYLRKSLIHLLSQFVLNLTLTYKEEMKQHFYIVVNNLVVTGVKYPDLLDVVNKTLDLLVVTYADDFTECIVSLDPFPNLKEFDKYKEKYLKVKYASRGAETQWRLHEELQSFLATRSDSWTLERLQWVRELLSQKKRDLDKLVKAVETKRFSDECCTSTDFLHLLIQKLIGVIKTNRGDPNVVLEAARCLGEIGPVDLSVLVLPTNKSKQRVLKGVAASVLSVIEILVDNLKSQDIQLVTVSGNVLRSVCQFADVAEWISKEWGKTRLEAILKPFRPTTPSTIRINEKVLSQLLETKLGLNELNENVDYPSWIIQLCCGLLECFKEEESIMYLLIPVCRISVEFCQEILPFLFFALLTAGKTNPFVRKTVSGYFHNFFAKFVRTLASGVDTMSSSLTPVMEIVEGGGTSENSSIYTNKLALRSLLGVIQFLRTHPAPQEYKGTLKMTPWDNNFWLEINYFDLAKAAQYCGAFLTSILFIEIAMTEIETGGGSMSLGMNYPEESILGDEDGFGGVYSQSQLRLIPPRGTKGDLHDKLLLQAYTSIGEPDAVYGCGSARFSEGNLNISHLQQRLQFHRVLSSFNGNGIDSESQHKAGVAGAMKDLGLFNCLWTYLRGVQAEEDSGILEKELADIQFECGWRLSKWDINCDKATYLKDGSFFQNSKSQAMLQRFVYESIQTGLTKDVVNHTENVKLGYQSVARHMRHASVESAENLYGFLSQLQMLRIVEDFFEEDLLKKQPSMEKFLSKWRTQDRINQAGFKFQEPLLWLRGVLLHSYGQKNANALIDSAYDDSMLELVSKARDHGRRELAEGCVSCVSFSSPEKTLRRDLEIAKNHWARGDHDVARQILYKLTKKFNESFDLYPNMLLLYGEWLSETMSERPAVILEKYLSRSCQIFEKRSSPGNQSEGAKAHLVLAKYADEQYQNVVKYMNSDLFSEKISQLDKAKQDYAAAGTSMDKEVKKSREILRRHTNIEQEEINNTIQERKKFLLLALKHYLRTLKDSNDNDLLVFRAVALWLENSESTDIKFNQDVNEIIRSEMLPSYKYVVVLNQLCPRLSINENQTNRRMMENLKTILMKCAEQHPYHTLPVLLTQSLLHEDEISSISTNSRAAPAARKKQNVEDRVAAATKVVDILKKNPKLATLTNKMFRLWQCLIHLANVQEKGNGSIATSVLIPSDAPIKKLQGLESVPVPTTTIQVLPNGDYNLNFVGIRSFEPTYAFVGGINSPKRIACVGTNGVKYNMLLKGYDDLRQDAVMQQVFSVMNKLLLAEPNTKARRLLVRVYKVVPLSQRSGILEWCENTLTLGNYLGGDDGAHQKYRPTDFTPMECRKRMLQVKDCGDNERKYSTFMTVLEHFKPVFRHFFFENFKEPGTFFERRLAYTRSVATNSMVGYILGLGDRHVLNILVDKTTAELIHIDLGVAFEQGRILPCPETIPFRLTRDIVDGMGISGIEGVFRKSCEMTLEVLRNNSAIIMTILEVLLYDPLYMWTLTADRMKKVQPGDNANKPAPSRVSSTAFITNHAETVVEDFGKERNSSAARVLLRLRQKLAGIEDGGSCGKPLNVSGHVSLLIQQAMDPERLCRLFPGWQPYL